MNLDPPREDARRVCLDSEIKCVASEPEVATFPIS